MNIRSAIPSAAIAVLLLYSACGFAENRPLIVAHRGASGYLPEHTLEAKSMAYAMGADYLEQDVVLTKDHQPVVLHDIHLDTVTNVAEVFPDRSRADGRFYAIDFTLADIKQLRVTERIDLETGQAVFPKRFPAGKSRFEVPTLAEEIELIQGLNGSTGRTVGIYTEIKSPAWHRAQGGDISRIVLEQLARLGYRDNGDLAYVQCFDPVETRRMRSELKTELKLVQLLADNSWNEAAFDFDSLRTKKGIRTIAEYADGIGPWMPHVVAGVDDKGRPQITSLVADAHTAGLEVHPFTLRADAMPKYCNDFEELLRIFLVESEVDGIFTDFPDRAADFRDRMD